MPIRPRPGDYDAILFDLDGVITDTASVHARCWKAMFDRFLEQRSPREGEDLRPFDIETDYKVYVDGKPRYEGVRSFLDARRIPLPDGDPDDAPERETICGLGNRKSAMVIAELETNGVEAYPGSLALLRRARDLGYKTAIVSSSKNCLPVLQAAGITDLFDVRVDGVVAAERGIPGKPAPDTFLAAAAELEATPQRCVVVEDAISGVQAGAAGKFGLVVGVRREGEANAFLREGAHVVVDDLAEMLEWIEPERA